MVYRITCIHTYLNGLLDCDPIGHHDDPGVREARLVEAGEGQRALRGPEVSVLLRQVGQHLLRLQTADQSHKIQNEKLSRASGGGGAGGKGPRGQGSGVRRKGGKGANGGEGCRLLYSQPHPSFCFLYVRPCLFFFPFFFERCLRSRPAAESSVAKSEIGWVSHRQGY